ncbi:MULTISPECIES: hypothetical protein [Marivita]|uniref:Helix-turn-helix domain-containing protein n=1 Tax=Marivita cryptomonadis TaxID=505252 RepID=A0A9Q2RYI1_9RHOB|nr:MULTISPECIES: hypothetical protein [Marivita]MCR9167195.1 hypothetical protein [Paracoccaceae bacterium]MBM2320508.1 hypothetical protein [Marivita cryptomonadis]MBM2330088.1 hypothetical protein [Marivita cryptomonadis]MBM2339675.1 hypothetical protein [Marivita cryptomonadis]MBM2344334.1 hypothetical protein [Marivita cryptomonadis]
MTKLLETPKELADRIGIPVTNVRYLIREDMLDHIFTAPGQRNPKIPSGAWEKYVSQFTVKAQKGAPRSAGQEMGAEK